MQALLACMLIPQPSPGIRRVCRSVALGPGRRARRGLRGFWLPSLGEPSARRTGGSETLRPGGREKHPTRGCPDMDKAPLGRVLQGASCTCDAAACYFPHTLSGAVPSPCQALASGFGMGPGVSPGPWPPQIFSCTVRRWGLPACGGSRNRTADADMSMFRLVARQCSLPSGVVCRRKMRSNRQGLEC